jgi:hypothetical protein
VVIAATAMITAAVMSLRISSSIPGSIFARWHSDYQRVYLLRGRGPCDGDHSISTKRP